MMTRNTSNKKDPRRVRDYFLRSAGPLGDPNGLLVRYLQPAGSADGKHAYPTPPGVGVPLAFAFVRQAGTLRGGATSALIGWGTDPRVDLGGTMRRLGEWGLSPTSSPSPTAWFGETGHRNGEMISSG